MLKSFISLALIPIGASCASHALPASPVPIAMTDVQAARMAAAHLDEHYTTPRMVTSIERQCDGYLVTFQTLFDAAARPPVESHLVAVNNDGTVRELRFKRNH